MALEMELKYLDVNLSKLATLLKEVGAETTGPYFETNLVFDYEDRSLKGKGTLLRLRKKQGKAVLTVKKLPDTPIPSALKVFEEIESEVMDFDAVKCALEAIGFSVAFGYEKVREKWKYLDCAICLDRLPFGDFVEIEGREELVPVCAGFLGLDPNLTTKLTYHALNIQHRAEKGLEPDENFLFDVEQKAALEKEIQKD